MTIYNLQYFIEFVSCYFYNHLQCLLLTKSLTVFSPVPQDRKSTVATTIAIFTIDLHLPFGSTLIKLSHKFISEHLNALSLFLHLQKSLNYIPFKQKSCLYIAFCT